MRQGLLERSERFNRVQSRILPQPLVERGDFKQLGPLRQLQIGFDLQRLERIAGKIESWFLCSKEEQDELGLGTFLAEVKVDIEVAQKQADITVEGANFSWWIFHFHWIPGILKEQTCDTIVPLALKDRLNERLPPIGGNAEEFLAWLKRQNAYLGETFDVLYDAKDYETVYVQMCAIFIFLITIYLGVHRAWLSGHYGLPQP